MSIFSDIFLSKDERAVLEIHKTLDGNWKNTNNFSRAFERYIEDLEGKFKLDFGFELRMRLITFAPVLLGIGITQRNSMQIFCQFIYYFVFGWQMPNRNHHSTEYILNALDNLDQYLKKNPSKIDIEFPMILDKSFAKKIF